MKFTWRLKYRAYKIYPYIYVRFSCTIFTRRDRRKKRTETRRIYIYISQQLLAIFFMKKKIGDFTLSETLFANKVGKKPIRYVIKSKIQSFFPHTYSNHRANSSGTDWLDRRRTQMIETSPWSHNVYYFFFKKKNTYTLFTNCERSHATRIICRNKTRRG